MCIAPIPRLVLNCAGLGILQFISIFLHLEYEVKANQAPATFHADHRGAAAAWCQDRWCRISKDKRVNCKHCDVTLKNMLNPFLTKQTHKTVWLYVWDNRTGCDQNNDTSCGIDKSSSCLLNLMGWKHEALTTNALAFVCLIAKTKGLKKSHQKFGNFWIDAQLQQWYECITV